jgi:hypothetical protein
MSKKQPGQEDSSHELVQRIVQLSELLWKGNRSQMGRDLGLAQPVVSRVLAGKHQPSGKLLEALAKWPGVSAAWLLVGEGEPLIEEGVGVGGRYRPIAEDLLPGPPDEHPDLLSGVGYPIAEAFASTTSYWFKIPNGIGVSGTHGVLAGDLLLMETDPRWTRKWGAIPGKFCGLLIPRPRGPRVTLARVEARPHGEFDPLDEGKRLHDVAVFVGTNEQPVGDVKFVVPPLGTGQEKATGPPKSATGKTTPVRLGVADVACVGVMLERRFDRWRSS